MSGAKRRVVFVNRYFAPDRSATSQIMGDLAFHLASTGSEVHVVCGDSLYAHAGQRLPREEHVNGVQVHRVSGGRFGGSGLAGRAVDYLGLYVRLRGRVARLLRRGDILVAKTDPPMLTVALAGIARKRGALFVPWLQDLYPEVAGALGVPLVSGQAGRPLTALRDRSLKHAHAIVVIGNRMRDRLVSRGIAAKKIRVVPNWSDDEGVSPLQRDDNELRAAWGLSGKFVVGYSGNLGRAHEYHTLLDAAERLRDHKQLAFLFIGGGYHIQKMKEETTALNIDHLFHFQPYQEKSCLSQSLSAPDVHWLSLRPELEGLIVPSKFYGIAAAGRPVINVGALDGEIGDLVKQFGCGTTVSPGDGRLMASVIERLMKSPDEVASMGQRARLMLVENYAKSRALAKWEALFNELSGANLPHSTDEPNGTSRP